MEDFQDGDGSRIRKDENYEKNYLLGKYGAIPSLETIRLLEEKIWLAMTEENMDCI